MKFKARRFYILAASAIIILILFTAAIEKYMPSSSKTSALLNKLKSAAALSGESSGHLECKSTAEFPCVVKYLHYLHYLPVSVSSSGKYGYDFSFPVPKDLQKAADSYKAATKQKRGAAASASGACTQAKVQAKPAKSPSSYSAYKDKTVTVNDKNSSS